TSTGAPQAHVFDGSTDLASGSATVAFGNVQVSSTSTKTFTVTNQGTTSLTLGTISVPAGWTLVSGFGSQTLTPGQSTTFQVNFHPSVSGNYSGTISFATNDSNANPFTFTVTGTAMPSSTVQFIDDGDAGFSTTGGWTWLNNQGNQGDIHYAPA